MNMQNYQLWLKDEQKEIILKYILDRRYSFMLSMYFSFIVATAVVLYSLPEFLLIKTLHYSADILLEPLGYFLIPFVNFLLMFLAGIGRKFGKNSDYDCIKNDNYELDFREFGGKEPDSGKHPYFVKDNYGNTYKCPLFLDWRNAQKSDTLICVSLKNGQKYALLQKVNLDKY